MGGPGSEIPDPEAAEDGARGWVPSRGHAGRTEEHRLLPRRKITFPKWIPRIDVTPSNISSRAKVAKLYMPVLIFMACSMLTFVFIGNYVSLVEMHEIVNNKNRNVLQADIIAAHESGRIFTSTPRDLTKELGSLGVTANSNSSVIANMKHLQKGTPGVSLVAACRNRQETLVKTFPTYLAASNISEIILVDWSSNPPLSKVLDAFKDPRVQIIRAENESQWILSRAFNLGISFAKYETIVRLDCDHAIEPDFVAAHTLSPDDKFFYAGNYTLARDENEVHINGAMIVSRSNFWKILGYDERIQTYGWDDEDMYTRLAKQGLIKRNLNYEKIHHALHGENARRQDGVEFATVETEVNRILLGQLSPWDFETGASEASIYSIHHGMGQAKTVTGTNKPRKVVQFFTDSKRDEAYDLALGRVLHDSFGVVWDLLGSLGLDQKRNLLREMSTKLHSTGVQPKILIADVQHGLGNRIRALGSAMAFAKHTNRTLVVIWQADSHCNAHFPDLFQNDIVWSDRGLHWPLEENIKWDSLWAKYKGYNYMEADGAGAKKGEFIKNDPEKHMYYRGAYIMECDDSLSSWERDNAEIASLVPSNEVLAILEERARDKLETRVGVHVRNMSLSADVKEIDPKKEYGDDATRTMDYWRAKSSIENFEKKMQEMLDADPTVSFYVASDTFDVTKRLMDKFPGRVAFQPRSCDSRDLGCLKYALVDMICLAKTKVLLGSNWSSFTEAVQRMGGKNTLLAGVDFAKDQ
mmetsp:Transcript_9185/g.18685  ORF Transcript_9185/g.18685 Transcript_9185/m.18685 type:complete len:753 (-) Transcript_9185:435-2693(-)|eukprot:CAMPEP_0184688538 /NCGR_PEP_ID=MMETSP0312-20130426/30154_1 /TAXON_ID=31354 /ORGANISM="Compsopogon coeruleus, Strain SAG 36.94" /LENGTH=752 /DNA_ID=CAMNT_0027145787 /DNA_START=222 /DNA_END=2480 /DNA_ORIENTATION=+